MRRTLIALATAATLAATPIAASAHGHHGGGLIFGIAALGTALVATTAAIASAPFYAVSEPGYYPAPQPYYASQPAPVYYAPQPAYTYNQAPIYAQQVPLYYPAPRVYYQPAPIYYPPQYYPYR